MIALMHRSATARRVLLACGLVAAGVAASPAGAVPERNADTSAGATRGGPSVMSSETVRLSIPRPTGRHPVGVRSTYVLDPARTDPTTGAPRAIPARVWYPARHRHGPSAPYFSAPVQAFIEQGLPSFGVPAPAGLFDIDTHATVAAPAHRHVRGVLLFMGGFLTPVALYTGLVADLASHGYAVVAFDHPHETLVVEQPDGSLIPADLPDDAATFQARLLDIGVVLDALAHLVPQARRHSPIGILGHSNGGAAAGEAMLLHRELRAGVNLDGFIPGGAMLPSGRLLTEGLDRPFGLMLSLDQRPEGLREIEIFLSNMRAPAPVRTLDVRHYGFSDFVVFNPQAQQADPALGAALEAAFPTGTIDSVRAGQRALSHQRRSLAGFFDRYLKNNPRR
jgi:pimeloyl-ACP methyl ester carboxylesterase